MKKNKNVNKKVKNPPVIKVSLENNKIIENVSLEKVMEALKKLQESQISN